MKHLIYVWFRVSCCCIHQARFIYIFSEFFSKCNKKKEIVNTNAKLSCEHKFIVSVYYFILIPAFTNIFRSLVYQIAVVKWFNDKYVFLETWLALIYWNFIVDFFWESPFYFGCWFFKPQIHFESLVLDIVFMFKISSVAYLYVFICGVICALFEHSSI